MSAPTEDEFRALARSAPWLFTTLRFTHRPADPRRPGPSEAWLRRPGRLRVKDGTRVHQVVAPTAGTGVGQHSRAWLSSGRPDTSWVPTPPQAREPEWRRDGLVSDRPRDPTIDFDDPMWQSYLWVAMLDPVELSTGTALTELAATQRQGRETWWARAVALDGYEPRCSCCPLLWGAVSDRLEFGEDGVRPRPEYPDRWLVGLDRQTGVVVSSEPLGGHDPLLGFSVDLHGVDETLDDDLFTP